MTVSAACPSCGAPVVFKSASSVFAVCDYCQSTLVRHDQALEDIGKMAALVEDRSPLQLGTEGTWQGMHFALIGRIQMRYEQGAWNEWHILFDDMRTGWLSEAAGEYVVSFLHQVSEPLPAFESLQAGQRLTLARRAWTVSNIEDAECIAGQGELPFKVGAGYKAPVVDLRDGENFATLDYSESPPYLFIGSPVDFKSFKFANLRQGMPIPTHTVEAQVFRCPSCGAPMSTRSKDILAVGCASCGAVVNTADQNYQLLSKALSPQDAQYTPRIPLGSKGTLEGKPVEAIGFLVKRTVAEGVFYDWREYLLAGENGGYRWLSEYDGHWNVADVLSKIPNGGGNEAPVVYEGQTYRHFSNANAEVIQVAGEFTWRVKRGEKNQVSDYVAPPLMLSRESTRKEISWSQGHYVEPETIRQAFRLAAPLPAPTGVYANQPNPWEASHKKTCRNFWIFALVALVAQLFFAFIFSGQTLLTQTLTFAPKAAEDTVTTNTFEIKQEAKKITVSNQTDLNNNWLGLGITLVNKNTGAAWPAERNLAYYAGVDEGESWSEGSRSDEVTFAAIPPGAYYLAIDPEVGNEKPAPVQNRLEVSIPGAGWSNYVLVMLFLMIFPITSRLRRGAFEGRRWAESDHAPVAADDSDDSDDD